MPVQFRRGLAANLQPANLQAGEPAYTTDTHELFVGNGDGTASNYGTNLQGQINSLTANTWSLSGGIPIPSGADLYNYTTVGNYYCPASNTVPTLLNKPAGLNAVFTMKVYKATGNGYPTQEIKPYNSSVVYKRRYNPYHEVWSDCGSTATSADIAAVNTKIDTYVEHGTNTNGEYYKYSDGRLECFKTHTNTNLNISDKWGTSTDYVYENSVEVSTGAWAYPFLTGTNPTVIITPQYGTGYVAFNIVYINPADPVNGATFKPWRPDLVTARDIIYSVAAFGRWK